MHSVETVLRIVIFSWVSSMRYDTLMMLDSGTPATAPSQPHDHEGKQTIPYSEAVNAF